MRGRQEDMIKKETAGKEDELPLRGVGGHRCLSLLRRATDTRQSLLYFDDRKGGMMAQLGR